MAAEALGRTGRFEFDPSGPYSLAASVRFLEGFIPARYEGDGSDRLRFAFFVDDFGDRGERAAGVLVDREGDKVVVETYGEAGPGVVRNQVERILSLDIDGSGFPGVGVRDPVVGELQKQYQGLRPVLFYSPYEAAAWAIIGNRIRIVQAARIKIRMAEQIGKIIEVEGEEVLAFPGPSSLLELNSFPGLSERKVSYLRALARAALEGRLEASHLRSLPSGEALAELKELPGIGDFSAELVLLRGAGVPDLLPAHEPRLARAVAMAYGLKEPPSAEALAEIAEGWRPYRTWVGLYLRTMLEDETGEISSQANTGGPKS